MKTRFASAADAPASSMAKHRGRLPARPAMAAARELRSPPAPCWRRSDNNRQMRDDRRDEPEAPTRHRMRNVSGPMRRPVATQDRRRACGRTKGPSAPLAQTRPAARLIEFSIGTKSSIGAAVPALARRIPPSDEIPGSNIRLDGRYIRPNCVAFSTAFFLCGAKLSWSHCRAVAVRFLTLRSCRLVAF